MSNLELQVSTDNGSWCWHFKKFLDSSSNFDASPAGYGQILDILKTIHNASLYVEKQHWFLVFETEADKLEFLLTYG